MPEERKVSLEETAIVGGVILFSTLIALAIIASTWAAPPTPPPGRAALYGRVTNAVTGEPISGVLVSLNGLEVYTDADGNYIFEDLEPGEYVLEFSKAGYETLVY
ncbi:hypothetical protein ES707_04065 [subsurface metagenome]